MRARAHQAGEGSEFAETQQMQIRNSQIRLFVMTR